MNCTVRYLLAVGTLTLAGVAQAAIPPAERQALLDLYSQTNGSGWVTSTGWNGAAGTECNWYGITCDGAQSHVTGVNLEINHLSGALPSLAALTNLNFLDLQQNQLTGSVAFLPSLTNLSDVYLSANQLSGSIPALSGLTNLAQFHLNGNQFSGSFPSLSGLTNLVNFQVNDNQLSGPLPPLSGLTSLAIFYASANQLTGSIPSLAGLSNLSQFDVDYNQLTGPIPSLSGLGSLNRVTLYHNQLTGPVPQVPNPNSLAAGQSRLCPNALDSAANPPSANDQAWNAATGTMPWSQQCTPPATYIVTTSSNAGGSITPASQTVNAGAAARFTVVAASGNVIAEIIDNCGPGGVGSGTFAGGKYTVGAINADCRVDASFAAVTPAQPSVQVQPWACGRSSRSVWR